MAFLINRDFICDNCFRNCDCPISYGETDLCCVAMVLLERDIKKLIIEEGGKYGLHAGS